MLLALAKWRQFSYGDEKTSRELLMKEKAKRKSANMVSYSAISDRLAVVIYLFSYHKHKPKPGTLIPFLFNIRVPKSVRIELSRNTTETYEVKEDNVDDLPISQIIDRIEMSCALRGEENQHVAWIRQRGL
jgi:hypothetical protein